MLKHNLQGHFKAIGRHTKEYPELGNRASQSAFLPGRLLTENVLLATEIIHGYNLRNVEPSGMLKVDLRKAFDTLRWDFVLAALGGLNIPKKFVNWIASCITSASFSICVNGLTSGYFKSTQ